MASPAQVKANRANSKLSTGPRSAEGKARSSRNGTSHGLSAADVIVFPGEEQAFADLRTSLLQDLRRASAASSRTWRARSASTPPPPRWLTRA